MAEISKIRNEIDEADTQIILGLKKRMNAVQNICEYKVENNLKTDDNAREIVVTEKYAASFKGVFSLVSKSICRELINTSKKVQNNIIAIVGMAGVGKSAVGSALAMLTNMLHIDLDEYIFAKHGKDIAYSSEPAFRDFESHCLAEILNKNKNIVLSCGGGVTDTTINAILLKEKTFVVHITREVIAVDTTKRPFITNESDYVRRKSLREVVFNHICDLTISNNSSADITADEIFKKFMK